MSDPLDILNMHTNITISWSRLTADGLDENKIEIPHDYRATLNVVDAALQGGYTDIRIVVDTRRRDAPDE